MTVKEHTTRLLKTINKGVWEKEQIIALSLLCSIAGESIFLLGPPGTAKSMVARRLKEAFQDSREFEYLMSRFSTPDEIFGPVSISKLKNEDCYERCIDGFLPSASIVFLDEIWKAGPSIQNTLLTVINEKIYRNGAQTLRIPLKGLIAASNELPAEDEGLEALWDRFLVRVISNCIKSESAFYKMLTNTDSSDISVPSSLAISDEEYAEWQENASMVQIPRHILEAITAVRHALSRKAKEKDINAFDYYISDRRWRKIAHILQTSAFLNDRDQVDFSDFLLLFFMLWNKVDCIEPILDIVADAVFYDVSRRLNSLIKEAGKDKITADSDDKNTDISQFKIHNHFYTKITNLKGNHFFHIHDYKFLSPHNDTPGVIYDSDYVGGKVVCRLDLSSPFASGKIGQRATNVMLRRIPGGISIDGKPCSLETISTSITAIKRPGFSINENAENLILELNSIRNEMHDRINSITEAGNIFISNDDISLIKKRLANVEQKLSEAEVKIINISSLL